MFIKHYSYLDFKLTSTEEAILKSIIYTFISSNKKIYLVGGCVRDALLNKRAKDIDFTTDATPEEMLELHQKYLKNNWAIIETGLKHGTVTFHHVASKISFEVTTFRADIDYTDHRHPDSVQFSKDLEEDLKRRDLTINSFAYDYVAHDLLMLDESYLYDLQCGIIRCVGDPNKRFQEDALRMMRAIRFSSQLGFSVDKDTFNAIKTLSNTISYVSHERIRDELIKILVSPYPQMIELLSMTGLSECIGLPLQEMLNESQHNKYHYTDVFHHTMDVVKAVPADIELRLSAFFHDFGKISTRIVDDEGWHHYYGHPEVSAEMCLKFMTDYKFDNTTIDHVCRLVRYHDTPIGDIKKKKSMKNLINNVGQDLMDKFFKLTFADRISHSLITSEFAINKMDEGKKKYINLLMNPEPMKVTDLEIDGYDLIELGYVGKEIGDELNRLMDLVLDDSDMNNKDVLIKESLEHRKMLERKD